MNLYISLLVNCFFGVILKVRYLKAIHFKSIQRLHCSTKITIKNEGSISFGKLTTKSNVHIGAIGGHVVIGNNVMFNRNCIIAAREEISIGDGSIFGPNVVIYDHDHIFSKEGIAANEYRTSPVVIEEGCWIGAGAIILRGTTIGKGSVIGAGTIVKGQIPPHSLVKNSKSCEIVPLR